MISSRTPASCLPTKAENSTTRFAAIESSQPPELPTSASEDATKVSTQYPSNLKSTGPLNKEPKSSFTISTALRVSPKIRQLLDQRANIEAGNLQRDNSGTDLPLRRSPTLQHLLDRRTASAGYTPGPKSSSSTSLNKASRKQQLFDRRPSMKLTEVSPRQTLQPRSSSLSSTSPDPFLDRKDLSTVRDITAPGGAMTNKTYLTSVRREKANSELSNDLRPKISLLSISPTAPATTTPTPHRSSRLSVSFDILPSSPPPSRPPPDPPLLSPTLPSRSPSRLVGSKLDPILIPTQPSKEDMTVRISRENQGVLSPAQTPKSSKLGFSPESAHSLLPDNSVNYFPPPSPPRTSSPVSAHSRTSSISTHSTHSITSITDNFDSLLLSPLESSSDVGECSFTARSVTLSRPKITMKNARITNKSDMERVTDRKMLKRFRKDVPEDVERTVVDISDDEDLFIAAGRSAGPGLKTQPPARKQKNESVGADAYKAQVKSSPLIAGSTDAKEELARQHIRKRSDAVEAVKAKIRLREDRLQQKLQTEEKQKNDLVAELQVIKAEAREINKRKKEKEAEIDQIVQQIKATNENMDELEQARETLTGVKRLLQ